MNKSCCKINDIRRLREAAEGYYEKLMTAVVNQDRVDDIRHGTGLREIRSRGHCRYDVSPPKAFMEEHDFLHETAPWLRKVHAILGPSAVKVKEGYLIALPTASAQGWHSDGPAKNQCYALAVLVALQPTVKMNGGTDVIPGSHERSAAGESDQQPKTPVFLDEGGYILFDYRLLHRAQANNATSGNRLVYYATFSAVVNGKVVFEDKLNYSKKAPSLKEIPSHPNRDERRERRDKCREA